MSIYAGQLIHRLEIQRATYTVRPSGKADPTWSTIAVRHAEIAEEKRAAVDANSGTLEQATVTFRMRYLRGLELDHQILFEGAPYKIIAIEEPERRVELLVECRRLDP